MVPEKMKLYELRQKQSMPLEAKVDMAERRIREWYNHTGGHCYVSYSGGKDSVVLLHLVRKLYPRIEAVFADTGLEYPETKEFVRATQNLVTVRPTKNFKQVIEEYGYPVVNKEQAQFIYDYMNSKSERLRNIRWYGDKHGRNKIGSRWRVLRHAPFKVSSKCCDFLKLNPIRKYEKSNRLNGQYPRAFVGSRADEGRMRLQQALSIGCNNLSDRARNPVSKPLTVWLEKDIWGYIEQEKLELSPIYSMGYKRTGCMFCMFGAHLEEYPNRFQMMKRTHPKLWDYCIYDLNLKQVLDWIGIDYEEPPV